MLNNDGIEKYKESRVHILAIANLLKKILNIFYIKQIFYYYYVMIQYSRVK